MICSTPMNTTLIDGANGSFLFLAAFVSSPILHILWQATRPMSSNKNRFWAASSSDDESYSDSSYSDSSEVEAPKKTAEKSKYVVISESESEEEKRVVKSPK